MRPQAHRRAAAARAAARAAEAKEASRARYRDAIRANYANRVVFVR